MPDRAGQTHNACKPDHFHSREDSQAGDAGDSITLDLCRSQPGTRRQNLSGEQLVICWGDWSRGGHHIERQIDSSQDDQLEVGTSDIEWLRKRIDPSATRYEGKAKLKYLVPLDDKIAERIKSLSKPYPQTRATSDTSDTPGVHPGKGGAARIVALQSLTDGSLPP